jgi:hypothetical protein
MVDFPLVNLKRKRRYNLFEINLIKFKVSTRISLKKAITVKSYEHLKFPKARTPQKNRFTLL